VALGKVRFIVVVFCYTLLHFHAYSKEAPPRWLVGWTAPWFLSDGVTGEWVGPCSGHPHHVALPTMSEGQAEFERRNALGVLLVRLAIPQ